MTYTQLNMPLPHRGDGHVLQALNIPNTKHSKHSSSQIPSTTTFTIRATFRVTSPKIFSSPPSNDSTALTAVLVTTPALELMLVETEDHVLCRSLPVLAVVRVTQQGRRGWSWCRQIGSWGSPAYQRPLAKVGYSRRVSRCRNSIRGRTCVTRVISSSRSGGYAT